ncbi:MAG: Gfo/Idh/MocA family protein [Elainellaceae cyanobacterium]
MRLAIVGCGFVADYYVKTLSAHPELELIGAMDRDKERAMRFADYYSVPAYPTLERLLEDDAIDIVLNLTNPRSHYEVSKACLQAGKHVYSEKPLAMELSQAKELVELAAEKNLHLLAAPCSLLGETAQTLWRSLRQEKVGPIRLVYAEMDDGMIPKMPYQHWQSESGLPWPYKDEFEVGCTLEHAGYYVAWLVAFFGPAQTITAFSSCTMPDKETDVRLTPNAPDFSVACIQFASGVVARLTCSIVAPHDHGLKIVGDNGILYTDDCWYYRSPVYIRRRLTIRRKTILTPWKRRCRLVGKAPSRFGYRGSQQMDFCRGVAEMAEAIAQQRPCRLSPAYALHVNEVVLAIHHARETGTSYEVTTTFDPIEPMPWAL